MAPLRVSMPNSSASQASGFQIAFLIFAVLLLAAPVDKYLFQKWAWVRESGFPLARIATFLFVAGVFLALPALRRLCLCLLSIPIPATKRKEIAAVVILDFVAGLGALGAMALYWWSMGGEPALARRMGEEVSATEQWSRALSLSGIVLFLVVGAFLGPIVEELVFRGMLYPAWERRLGWLGSAIATSVVFALAHPRGAMVPQFLVSLWLIGLFRRTGSLRACIVVHAIGNVLLWFPLLGQFVFPAGRETGELRVWSLHLACLAMTCVALPVFLRLAREPGPAARLF